MSAMFGELVVDLGFLTEEQLDEAIALQKKGRARLGQLMIHMMILTSEQVDQVLAFQNSEEGAGKRFGECALEMGLISKGKLDEAVHYQTTSKGVLGDLLIELGYLTHEQRTEVIKAQMSS